MRFTDIFIPPCSGVWRPWVQPADRLMACARAFFDLSVRQYSGAAEHGGTPVSPPASPAPIPNPDAGLHQQPIEQAVAERRGIDYMTSSSTQGTSQIQAYIKLNYDPNKAMTDVMAKGAAGQISDPAGIERPRSSPSRPARPRPSCISASPRIS
jgi:multidrug efflux pump